MRCPHCDSTKTQVKDSRATEENRSVRRRRICAECGGRFTTFERVRPAGHGVGGDDDRNDHPRRRSGMRAGRGGAQA